MRNGVQEGLVAIPSLTTPYPYIDRLDTGASVRAHCFDLGGARMPEQRRFEKTVAKTRRGGLPAPTHDPPELMIGDGTQCDGCEETIAPTDQLRRVSVRGVFALRFHDSCYTAWASFKPL